MKPHKRGKTTLVETQAQTRKQPHNRGKTTHTQVGNYIPSQRGFQNNLTERENTTNKPNKPHKRGLKQLKQPQKEERKRLKIEKTTD